MMLTGTGFLRGLALAAAIAAGCSKTEGAPSTPDGGETPELDSGTPQTGDSAPAADARTTAPDAVACLARACTADADCDGNECGEGFRCGEGGFCRPDCSEEKVLSGDLAFGRQPTITVGAPVTAEELAGVTAIDGSLKIVGPDHEDLAVLTCLTRVTGDLSIGRNCVYSASYGCVTNGTQDDLQSLEGLEALQEVGGALLLDHLPALRSVEALSELRHAGSLELRSLPKLESLHGLEGITELETLTVSDATALRSLAGLENLTRVGTLSLEDNPLLESLDGLDALDEIGTMLAIFDNTTLFDIGSLDGLTIAENGRLRVIGTSLVDLEPLSGVGGVLRSVEIDSNPALVALTGLEGVTAVESAHIGDNPNLQTLHGLEGLRSAESLFIYSNVLLSSLAALENLESVSEFAVYDNTALPQCEVDAMAARFGLTCGSPSDAACSGNDPDGECP